MKKAVVFDKDGTLVCGKHRLDLLPPQEKMSDPRAFDAMNLQCYKDEPFWDVIETARSMAAAGHPIVILTRANEIARPMVLDQIQRFNIPCDELVMARWDDTRADREWKEEQIKYIDNKYGGILAFYDDQPKVCSHIRSLGYTCYHVCDPYEQAVTLETEDD